MAAQQEDPVVTTSGIQRLALGGEMRARTEYRDPRSPMTNLNSDSTAFGRALIHLDADINDQISAKIELQESVNGAGNASGDTLHQAYAQLRDIFGWFDFQGGRFEMNYGKQRMISVNDWDQFRFAWDGARFTYEDDEEVFDVDVFLTKAVAGQGAAHNDVHFHGIYGGWNLDSVRVEGYVLHRDDSVAMLEDYTVGALVTGDVDNINWDAEGAVQFGDHWNLDANGFAFAASATIALENGLDIGGGISYASGDDNPTDGDDGTFRQLFHYNHAYLGYADVVVWQNVLDIHANATYAIDENWDLTGAVHLLTRADDMDAIYTGMGATGVVGAAGESAIGTEIDAGIQGRVTDNVGVWAGAAQFFAGDGIVNNDDMFWLFAQVAISF